MIHYHIFCRKIGQSQSLHIRHTPAAPANIEHVNIAIDVFGDKDLHDVHNFCFRLFGRVPIGNLLLRRGIWLRIVRIRRGGGGLFLCLYGLLR